MSQTKKWIYYVASCHFKETKKANLLGIGGEGHWALVLDRVFPLDNGLSHMGDLGYELVGIQAANLLNGGQSREWYKPSYLYIFKKPVEE